MTYFIFVLSSLIIIAIIVTLDLVIENKGFHKLMVFCATTVFVPLFVVTMVMILSESLMILNEVLS